VRFLVDTNILAYAVNRDGEEHGAAMRALEGWLSDAIPWAVTWSIVYEFLRVVTHPRIFRRPLAAEEALAFLSPILTSDVVTVIGPTPRHEALLRSTVRDLGRPAGNLFHDLHTAVTMREHGVAEIMTADTDFRKFPFLTVTNPLRQARFEAPDRSFFSLSDDS
jgi:toxin-antitoxin system PIN domain toxin